MVVCACCCGLTSGTNHSTGLMHGRHGTFDAHGPLWERVGLCVAYACQGGWPLLSLSAVTRYPTDLFEWLHHSRTASSGEICPTLPMRFQRFAGCLVVALKAIDLCEGSSRYLHPLYSCEMLRRVRQRLRRAAKSQWSVAAFALEITGSLSDRYPTTTKGIRRLSQHVE